jgi:hypothetical protein
MMGRIGQLGHTELVGHTVERTWQLGHKLEQPLVGHILGRMGQPLELRILGHRLGQPSSLELRKMERIGQLGRTELVGHTVERTWILEHRQTGASGLVVW